MDTAIVVFTRDLRLHDNPTLHQASARARQVVPVFVVDPAIAAPPNRARFLAESLADLRASLRERGGDLVIRDGDPAAEVIKLAGETKASAVYLADDVSHYATARRRALERECARHRLDLVLTPGLTVVPPGDLKPASGGHYRVFTPYWRAWRAATWRRGCPVPQVIQIPAMERVGRIPGAAAPPRPGQGRRDGWPPAVPRLAEAPAGRLRREPRRPGRRRDLQAQRLPAVRLRVAARSGDRRTGPPGRRAVLPAARLARLLLPGDRRVPRHRQEELPARGGLARTRIRPRWTRGARARPGYRSWTPACASWPPRASCTTAPG